MHKIIAFGCSNTFGQGLPDCYKMEGDIGIGLEKSSQYAWPEVFAKKMKKSCVNLAQPGSSNRQILWQILNFEYYQPRDCVTILWTFINRSSIIKSQHEISQLHIREWSGQPIENKAWRKYKVETYNEYDEMIRSLHYIDYADRFLKDRVGYVMHYVTDNTLLDHKQPYVQADIIRNGKLLMTEYPKGLDGVHHGIEGHQALGSQAVNDFNNLRKRKIKNEY